jgi:hypothetical protein
MKERRMKERRMKERRMKERRNPKRRDWKQCRMLTIKNAVALNLKLTSKLGGQVSTGHVMTVTMTAMAMAMV